PGAGRPMAVSTVSDFLHLLQPGGAESDAGLLRRFVKERDEEAFAALVHRHGPLVWSVCRRALRKDADADDAFQATFLILARKARTLRRHWALAGWLHAVAVNVSREAARSAQ